MTDIEKELDQPKSGLVFDRGFWRHPTSGAVMLKGPDGKKKARRAPSGDYKQHLDETTNLNKWQQRQIVVGLLSMFEAGARFEPTTDRHVLDGLVLDAMTAAGAFEAAEQGTHSHLLSELNDEGAHWLTEAEAGEDIGLPTRVQEAIVKCWQRLVEPFDVLHVEQTVANDMVAGTLDRLVRCRIPLEFERVDGSRAVIEEGEVIVLDVKTGKLRYDAKGRIQYWGGYCLQIGHYANSRPVTIDPDDPDNVEWGDWDEPPSTRHAIIAHLDVANALDTGVVPGRLIYVDLAEYDKMCGTINEIRYWRKQQWFSKVTDVPSATESVELDKRTEVPYEEVIDWMQRRIDRIGQDKRARQLLSKHWPQGVVPPKDGLAIEDFDQIVSLLNRVEAEVGMPFGATDPRVQPWGHKGDRVLRPVTQPNKQKEQSQ